ncbi:flagellar motor protein [Paenibacillus flagellatus]|uniref:Flagellar motor protein n=1 Tax=Paenibacillus flagellatus TaxID=2211139 RepID=A0A2V5K160_9BACL|nr:flagellar motor protein [Paenibacillus flagellatus]PYI51243.1 flagellar motor protein [Paenibacillus flagellatus]
MDLTTLLGILLGLLALVGGFLLEDGHISGLLVYTAAIIVFGGTFGAVVVSFPKSQLKLIPEALRMAFREPKSNPAALIEELVDMAVVARREGVLALEDRAQQHPNAFLREGLQMVVDGTDPDVLRQILEVEIEAKEKRHQNCAKLFEAAGGYAPTMGIIGTVMGLIHVLSNMSDPASLAGAIAVAFTATLYGVGSANVLYLPIANKIKVRSEELVAEMDMMLEGMLALQAGENPQLIQKKLASFLQLDAASFGGKDAVADGEET